MDDTRCIVCGSEVEEGVTICPKCGFNFVGKTESFQPIDEGVEGKLYSSGAKSPTLTITKGPLAGESFAVNNFPMSLGRDPSCDLFLNNMTVSRKHAEIEKRDEAIYIRDLNSLNGTWINGQIIDGEVPLDNDALIQIGTFTMVFSIK